MKWWFNGIVCFAIACADNVPFFVRVVFLALTVFSAIRAMNLSRAG